MGDKLQLFSYIVITRWQQQLFFLFKIIVLCWQGLKQEIPKYKMYVLSQKPLR